MYIENDDFSVWMQKLYAKLEELCKDVRVLRNADRVLPEDDNLLDNQDLCLLFKVSIKTLQRYRAIGALPYFTISGKVYYKASDVREFIKERFSVTTLHQSRKNTARRKRSELKSRGGSAPASLWVYGLPSLSASSLSCSACSFNSLARSNASACFLLRYSKPFTESVRLRMKVLSRSRLNFVSSKSSCCRLPFLSSGYSDILYRCPVTAAFFV